jgi:Fe-S-cluster containining protein
MTVRPADISHASEVHAAEQIAYRQRLDVFLASRDAGETLTVDRLRDGIRLMPVVSAAEDVTRYVDTALAVVRDEYDPPLECRAGCTFCCCKPGVLATVPEVLRLVEFVQTTFSAARIEALTTRTDAYAASVGRRSFNDPFNESIPCPLLVDGLCSAYEVRPLVCRGYNSTSVDACRAASVDSSAAVPIFALLKDVTDGATVGVSHGLQARGVNGSLVDLGTALHIALHVHPPFADAVLAGSVSLETAENPVLVRQLWTAVCETARQVGIPIRDGNR